MQLPLDKLRPHPRNPRNGDVEAIAESLRANGQYRPIVVSSDSYVLAGNHTYMAALQIGWTHIAAVQLAVTHDSDEALRIMLVDNRTADLGNYDNGQLLELLQSLDEEQLLGTGYVTDDIDTLLHRTQEGLHGLTREAEVEAGMSMKGKRTRTLPLDLIYSCSGGASHAETLAAFRLGWQAGLLSSAVTSGRMFFSRYPRAPRLAFMDNPWHGYDHDKHTAAVRELRPKYATTRDLLTREQCQAAGVEYLSLEQVLDQAAELAPYCDNVILIPKYDCLDKLPEAIGAARVVLGYSVQSSYGGTELPIKAFTDRPIHLLGGSWKRQRAYLNLMGEDVVSLDNNHLLNVAGYGQVCLGDGTMVQVKELLGYPVERTHFPTLVLSLAFIATEIMHTYGVPLEAVDIGELAEEEGQDDQASAGRDSEGVPVR